MFFRKKNSDDKKASPGSAAPPPWENIDTVPEMRHSNSLIRFNLTGFVAQVTGFGTRGAKFLLFGFAISLAFLSYAFYVTARQRPPLPIDVHRPAMDKSATSTLLMPPTSTP